MYKKIDLSTEYKLLTEVGFKKKSNSNLTLGHYMMNTDSNFLTILKKQ